MSAPDNETLRGWLAARIPGDLRGLQLGEDWNRMTMVSRIDTRAGTLNAVARIDHADAAEALATACLFAVAPALAEEVLLLRERVEKAEAERDALRAAAIKACAGWDGMRHLVYCDAANHIQAMDALYLVAHGTASGAPRCVTTSQPCAAEVLRAEGLAIGSLLSVIHRDGGHHMAEHGVQASCAAAERVVCDERARLDAVEHAARACRDATDVLIGAWAVRDGTRTEHWIKAELSRVEAAEAQAKARAELDRVLGGGR